MNNMDLDTLWSIGATTHCVNRAARRGILVHLESQSAAVLWGTHVNGRIQIQDGLG